jgi:hypothetical protein
MDLMGLIIGVCLPLLAGFAFLNLVGPTDSRPSRFLRRTGYGYFLGCVLLYVLLKTISLLSGELRPVWVALALSVVTVVAAWLGRHKFRYSAASLDRTLTSSQRMLIATLLAWMAIHLFFSAVEVGVNPVYPWDAWTVWVYRAKAWFFSDRLFDFMTFGQWLQAATAESYTTPALKYPWLPSIMPLWAALCLGNWHEALVGVPVVVAGLALTASFYGQLRAIDLPPLPAVVFTAFLASTPLWGVHLSLAGRGRARSAIPCCGQCPRARRRRRSVRRAYRRRVQDR